jgi:hypothetical protein
MEQVRVDGRWYTIHAKAEKSITIFMGIGIVRVLKHRVQAYRVV